MKMTGIVIPIGVPSKLTGRIFSLEIVEQLVNEFNERKNNPAFDSFPTLGELGVGGSNRIEISRVSHTIEELFIEDGNLMATIKVFASTPMGNILNQLLEDVPFVVHLCLRGTGSVDDDSAVTEFKIIAIDVNSSNSKPEPVVIDLGVWFDSVMDSMRKDGLL